MVSKVSIYSYYLEDFQKLLNGTVENFLVHGRCWSHACKSCLQAARTQHIAIAAATLSRRGVGGGDMNHKSMLVDHGSRVVFFFVFLSSVCHILVFL